MLIFFLLGGIIYSNKVLKWFKLRRSGRLAVDKFGLRMGSEDGLKNSRGGSAASHSGGVFSVLGRSFLTLVSVVVIIVLAFSTIVQAETNDWAFDNAGDYDVSSAEQVEVTGNTAKLRLQEYNDDAHAGALYHLNDNGTDASGNGNDLSMTGSPTYDAGKFNNGLNLDGATQFGTATDSATLSPTGNFTVEGNFKLNSAFAAGASQSQTILDKGSYQAYLDRNTGKMVFEAQPSSGANDWQKKGGDGVNSSWLTSAEAVNGVYSSAVWGDDLYVGLYGGIGDAEVWKCADCANASPSGKFWTKVGGDGVNSSWAPDTYEYVRDMVVYDNKLFVGLGADAGDAEVWYFNGSSWAFFAGDDIGWTGSTHTMVYSLATDGANLYVGLGASYPYLYRWNGSTWLRIAGYSYVYGGWNTFPEAVMDMVYDGTYLYAGLSSSTGDAEVWRCTTPGGTPSWAMIGGDGINNSWPDATFEYAFSLTLHNGGLYAGLGSSTGDAEVWRTLNPQASSPTWGAARIGGDGDYSSWANSTYETVSSLASDGTYLYAGLGSSTNDAEVWRCATPEGTPSWTKIGGDGVNSSWAGSLYSYYALNLISYSGYVFAGIYGPNTRGELWRWDAGASSWLRVGGDDVYGSWTDIYVEQVRALQPWGDYLYAGLGNSAGDAHVWRFNGSVWERVGGDELNGSWATNVYEGVSSMAVYNNELYVGLGDSTGDGEVWKYNGTTWSFIGGDGTGWPADQINIVKTMVSYGEFLYVGLGNGSSDAEVWRWNGSSWFRIAGDGVFGSFTNETVYSLAGWNGKLYVGEGFYAGVWECTGPQTANPSWVRVGGEGVNGSWVSGVYNYVHDLTVYKNELFAGIGGNTGESEVWKFNGSSWTKVGGDGIGGSWTGASEYYVYALTEYNGYLYASLYGTSGDGTVWQYDGSSWTKVGGDDLNGSWQSLVFEGVASLTSWKGKLYAGLGISYDDGEVWAMGGNALAESTATSWDTGWHHFAGVYNGSTLRLYIDGMEQASTAVSMTLVDNPHSLYIGSSIGDGSSGRGADPPVCFAGMLDEVRVSNTARGTFYTTQYANTAQTVEPKVAFGKTGSSDWTGFAANETPGGGTIKYRLSDDEGATWQWWSGAAWTGSGDLSQANTAAEVDAHIGDFNVGDDGLLWQAVLLGNDSQQVTLNSVTLTYSGDVINPTNPTTVEAKNALGGTITLNESDWYNYGNPSFTWTGATDASGIKGYYVYFGTSSTENPQTGGAWQTSNTYTYSGLALTTDTIYYLRVRAKDNANNVFTGAAPDYHLFAYHYDKTTPESTEYINVSPAGCSKGPTYSFSWPAPADTHGISGYKYKVGSSGTVNTTAQTSVSGIEPYQEGDNTFYLKAVDTAGNDSIYWQTAVFCYEPSASITQGPTVEAKPSSITVIWETDKEATGYVKVLQGNTYVSEQGHTEYTRSHTVKVVGLNPSEQYRYNLRWVDRNSNLEESEFFTTSTQTAPRIADFQVTEIRQSSAIVSFSSTVSSRCVLKYGISSDYGNEINLSNDFGTSFAYKLENLEADNDYHVGITATDQDNLTFESSDYQFATLPFPQIDNVSFEQVKDMATTTYKVTWTTNVKTSSAAEYGPQGGTSKTISSPEMALIHELVISDLADQTTYTVGVSGRDDYGNEAHSNSQTLTTPLDTRPPKISDIVVESSTAEGAGDSEGKSQMVVSWRTDEGASSAVEYGEGIESNDYTGKTPEDSALTTFHVVVIRELNPSKPYHLRVVSADKGGNKITSANQVVVSGQPKRTVLSLIIKSLQRAFGWLGDIGDSNQ